MFLYIFLSFWRWHFLFFWLSLRDWLLLRVLEVSVTTRQRWPPSTHGKIYSYSLKRPARSWMKFIYFNHRISDVVELNVKCISAEKRESIHIYIYPICLHISEYSCTVDDTLCTSNGVQTIIIQNVRMCCPHGATFQLNNSQCICVEDTRGMSIIFFFCLFFSTRSFFFLLPLTTSSLSVDPSSQTQYFLFSWMCWGAL